MIKYKATKIKLLVGISKSQYNICVCDICRSFGTVPVKAGSEVKMSDKEVNYLLHFYGSSIMHSEEFRQAMKQTHHKKTTVGDHSIKVARASIKICRVLNKFHIKTRMDDVVIGSLCHDLGILGRKHSFSNGRECLKEHPVRSLDVARRLIPDINYNTEKIIRCHMWPIAPLRVPTSRESIIVSIADKYAAIGDGIMRTTKAAELHIKSNAVISYGPH